MMYYIESPIIRDIFSLMISDKNRKTEEKNGKTVSNEGEWENKRKKISS